jgi:hypothetical protein
VAQNSAIDPPSAQTKRLWQASRSQGRGVIVDVRAFLSNRMRRRIGAFVADLKAEMDVPTFVLRPLLD